MLMGFKTVVHHSIIPTWGQKIVNIVMRRTPLDSKFICKYNATSSMKIGSYT